MPAAPQTYVYKSGPMEPVVQDREVVGVWVNKAYTFYEVNYVEGITASNPITINLGAIAAGANTAVIQLLLLEMPEAEFGQFRAEVMDDFEMILYQGRADQRHKTNQVVARYSRFTALADHCGHMGEFFVHEDDWAFAQAFNMTDYALALARVSFWGFRFVCTELEQYSWTAVPKKLPPKWTAIPATAHV